MSRKSYPAIVNNEQLLEELWFVHKKNFSIPILKLRKELQLPNAKYKSWLEPLKEEGIEGWNSVANLVESVNKKREEFMSNLYKEERNNLLASIVEIVNKNDLGKEWLNTILDIIVSGFFKPPIHNLYVGADKKGRKLSIELNSTTTLTDIKEAWGYIDKKRIEVFGKVKERHFSGKLGNHIWSYTEAQKIRQKTPTLKGEDVYDKSYKTTDLDIVGMLYSGGLATEDHKRAANLRQIRRRLKVRAKPSNS